MAPPADDPFARAAAGRPERTIPDLALEETERTAAPVHQAPERTVASRDPGLIEFGDVDLTGPDVFGEARRAAFGEPARTEEPAHPASDASDDPLAGFSLSDLGSGAGPSPSTLPPPVEAPPLPPPAPPAPPATVTQPVKREPREAHPDAEQDVAAEAERSRRRLRTVGVNALSLIALVVLAVVLFEVWRGRQSADPSSSAGGPALALDVSSGPYETASGKPVVVVRGRVQATAPLRRAEVHVELLDGGRAVAVGKALAGAEPTAEEVHAVSSAADAEELADRIALRAPAQIRAGDVLPFTAVIADPPADLRALEVRVSLRAEALGK